MEVLKDRYSITELSERLQVTDHALRYYEKEFNLSIPKDERGRRFYTAQMANIMFQIKNMRDEGLEIKAIRKILQSENIIAEPPPVVLDEHSVSVLPVQPRDNSLEIRQFFEEFRDQITSSVSVEVTNAREHLSRELGRTKLELGACVENSVRKLETKMEKHFQEVDKSLSNWRDRKRRGITRRLMDKLFKDR